MTLAAPSTPHVTTAVHGAVGHVVLARPTHRNAISASMFAEIRAAFAAHEAAADVRVIVLRSALPGMFCAGADIASLADPRPEQLTAGFRNLEDTVACLRRIEKPIVTLVDGDCIGAGCALAAASDIVVASEPSRFRLPEVHLDLAPVLAVSTLYPVVAPRALMLWAATGRWVTAREALTAGLASHVVPRDTQDGDVATLLDELARPSTHTQALLKRTFALLGRESADGAVLMKLMLETATHADTQDAVARFLARKRNRLQDVERA